MASSNVFEEIIPRPKSQEFPFGWKYSPDDFEVGSRVRIYLAYVTNQDIRVREGIVTNTKRKKGIDLALELRVYGYGWLMRVEPRTVGVVNADGYTVWGVPAITIQSKPYRASYSYAGISRAEKKKKSTKPL